MLTIHVGLPKTATTAAQKALAASSELLRGGGIDYLDVLRNKEGVAHHILPAELLERCAIDGPSVQALIDHVRANHDRHMIVSSEALTNLLAGPQRAVLGELISVLAAITDVRTVITLRRIDDFFTSMYLQSAKVGEVSQPIEEYLAGRPDWPANLFMGIAMLQEHAGVSETSIIKYESGAQFLKTLLGVIVGDPAIAERMDYGGRDSARLTLKGHTILYFLDRIGRKVGYEFERFPLIRAMELGKLTFENDTTRFSLLRKAEAEALHEQALEAARKVGQAEYLQFFENDVVRTAPRARLRMGLLEDDDFERLREHAARLKKVARKKAAAAARLQKAAQA